ncbi:MAG TPA: FAD:protein FMN transferase [Candidatus Saccharimonadales bacterium]|nr:FAD:protein FMN transferase [Candidatus Saccharimonadales bacterium]
MVRTEQIMGMPITVEAVGAGAAAKVSIDEIFEYFRKIDARYSTYKKDSEISRINGGLARSGWSEEMRRILELCEQTKQETDGYFDINHNGQLDPSGLVKGWAINQAAGQLRATDIANFRIEAGGDIQAGGHNSQAKPWKIGIRNPFNRDEIIKVVEVSNQGVATSGTAIRGQHIYNPHAPDKPITDIASLTVIGPDIYEADRFATGAFAMGEQGIAFIESRPGLEGYMIKPDKTAVFTSGFERYAR